MTAQQLFQTGKLDEAVQALSAELRENPTDTRRRTFLFELLCFAGEYDRAEKQLDVLAQGGQAAELGALLYRGALAAERNRQELFGKREYPSVSDGGGARGTLNGKPFESLADADPRIGPRLELFAAGTYMWLPFNQLASIELQAPKRLRDLLWIPALVRPGRDFRRMELGEVILPVLSPFSARHSDDAVRLGRATVWEEDESGEPVPFGQKMLLVDGEEVPLLEVRKIEFAVPENSS